MRRREVIAALLLTATVPRAQAQQRAKFYRIALVHPSDPVSEISATGTGAYWHAFFRWLREVGYVEGENCALERYSAGGQTEHYAELAAKVVRSKPDLIHVVGDRVLLEVKAATDEIPVVTTVGDPVAQGIVTSLARPGGNITGVTVVASVAINGKSLELLREMVPTASRVGWLASRRVWEGPYGAAVQEAAKSIKISIIGPPLEPPFHEPEYRRVIAAMSQAGADALFVFGQPENLTNAPLIVELAEKARLPAIYVYAETAKIGGLMTYGTDRSEIARHVVLQIDQILKGAKPGEIPFYQPTKFTLTINLKTAKALGITVPPTLLIAADEVIE
jgi:putative ABC transport system substrate-binding protein